MTQISIFPACIVLVTITFSFACALEAPRLPVGAMTPAPEGDDWINLFDAEHASHWKNMTDSEEGIFTIEDGVFHVKGQKPTRYIAWMGETFGDFELHVEFKCTPGANSGLFFRSDPKDPVQGGMEIQVYGDPGAPPTNQGSGSLYDIATPMFNMALPAGEWNSYDITFRGSHLVVVYNGWKVLDLDVAQMTMPIGKFDTPLAEMPRAGHIILQDHGDEVWFRNLNIRRL